MVIPYEMFSNHIFGGELEATCSGNGNYTFKLTLYAACNRISPTATGALPSTNTIDVYNSQNSKITSITVTAIKRDTLPVIPNPCAQQTGGNCVGRVQYSGTGNLPPIVGGYTLAFGIGNRNINITNLITPDQATSTYSIKLPGSDKSAQCDNAPVFNALPPAEICTNMPADIDFSASDADGDVLKYSLVAPYQMGTPPFPTVTFSAPYTATDPLNCGLTIDANTGHITGTPKQIGLFVIGVLVQEYRNGVLIGEKIRDFTYTVVACSPTISVNNPMILTCANSPVQFSYTFAGTIKAGTKPEWDFGDPASGANNKSNLSNPTHQYTALGNYKAKITIYDNCDNKITNNIDVNIVETKGNVTDNGPYCKGQTVELSSNDAGCTQMTWYKDKTTATPLHTGCNYSFPLTSDSATIYFEPYVDPTIRTVGGTMLETWGTYTDATFDAIMPLKIDGFTVQGDQWWNACTNFNASFSIVNANGVTVAGPVTRTVNCFHTTPTVITGLNLIIPPGNGYRLVTTGATLFPISANGTVVNQMGMITITNSGAYSNWQVESQQKCAVRDSIKIISNCPCPDTSLTFASPLCSDLTFDANILKTNKTSLGTWSIVQSPNGNNPATLNSSIFNPNKNGDAGTYTLRYNISGTISPDCVNYNERTIIIHKKETAKINRPQGPFCISEGVQTISLDPTSDFGTWTGQGITNGVAGLFDPTNNLGPNLLTYSTDGKCSVKDTITIVVVSQKISDILTTDTSVCVNASPFNIRLSKSSTTNGLWVSKLTGIVNNKGLITPQASTAGSTYKVYYILTGNTVSCSAIDSVEISFLQKDTAKISLNQGPFCAGSAPLDLALENISATGTFSGLGITNASNGTFDPSKANIGNNVITYTTSGACPHIDTIHLNVKAKTIAEILSNDTSICQGSTPFSIRLSKNSSSGGQWYKGITATNDIVNPLAPEKFKLYYSTKGIAKECDAIDSVNIEIKEQPQSLFDADKLSGCLPLEVNFEDLSDSLALNSTWLISENGKIIDSIARTSQINYVFHNPGCFNVELKNNYNYGCKSSMTLPNAICAQANAVANFDILDLPKNIQDPTLNVVNLSTSANSYLWKMPEGSPDTSNLFNAYTRYNTDVQDTFKITLIAKNDWCMDSITKSFIIFDIATINVPNAFTPNGDGLNDAFYPIGRNVSSEKYHFMIFNRWGELIFETHEPLDAWNGKKFNSLNDAQIDVYIWKLNVFNQFSNELKNMIGTVSLLR